MIAKIKASPQKIRSILLKCSAVICLTSLLLDSVSAQIYYGKLAGGPNSALGKIMLYNLNPLFSVGNENNIPTYYSSMLLLFASVCCLLTWASTTKSSTSRSSSRGWKLLSSIFLALSFDELASIHEKIYSLASFAQKYSKLHSSMAIPRHLSTAIGALIMLLVLFKFVPFLASLSKRAKAMILLSGAIYTCGAIGVEAISLEVKRVSLDYGHDLTYLTLSTIEEFMEMAGISFFICAVLTHISKNNSRNLVPIKNMQLANGQQLIAIA